MNWTIVLAYRPESPVNLTDTLQALTLKHKVVLISRLADMAKYL